MKAIILCAGHAIRLYPLTKNKPKALLPIAGKPILNYIIEKIHELDEVNEIFITTNSKFYEEFVSWLKLYEKNFDKKIKLFVNSSTSYEEPISLVSDISEIIKENEISEDILIIAGDNLFEFSLKDFVDFYNQKEKTLNVVFKLGSKEEACRFGVVELQGDKIIGFEEKPENPKSDLISMAVYVFTKDDLKEICECAKTASPRMGIGDLLRHFFEKQDIYSFVSSGRFIDIGVEEDYKKASEFFGKERQ